MKGGNQHRVPLSARAIEILEELPREKANGFLFVGPKAGSGLSNTGMFGVLRRMSREATTHGFRSSFRDWVAERTAFPHEVAEQALAHVVGNAVERAYRRGDLFAKRKQLMDAWGKFLSRPTQTADVVPIRGKRR
jgi:integrase